MGRDSDTEKLLKEGVRDMVRISDARMSGTHFGTVILHASPEAAAGGPLAVVEDGDMIRLDLEAETLDLEISQDELARRLKDWQPPVLKYRRGYMRLFSEHVLGPEEGCDQHVLRPDTDDALDFVEPTVGRS
jgi:dihydroxyacid dehydratase/phosphogluconate dehydratase